MSSDNTYQGWTNYETWAVALWIDNDEGLHNEYYGSGITASDLKREFQEGVPDDIGGLWIDLIQGSLDSVNWEEIAEHLEGETESETDTEGEADDSTTEQI
jgi:hypothetical protein